MPPSIWLFRRWATWEISQSVVEEIGYQTVEKSHTLTNVDVISIRQEGRKSRRWEVLPMKNSWRTTIPGLLAEKFLPDLRFVRNHHKPPNRNDLSQID